MEPEQFTLVHPLPHACVRRTLFGRDTARPDEGTIMTMGGAPRGLGRGLCLLAAMSLGLAACNTIKMPGGPKPAGVANVCEDFTVSVYFDQGAYRLTREAKAVLDSAGGRARGCTAGMVQVTGLADAVGAPDANLQLSERRAASVTKALGRLGFTDVKVSAAGESGAQTKGGADRPLRRRADIVVHLSR
jgi:peptidoglycan-associated lipoprotein